MRGGLSLEDQLHDAAITHEVANEFRSIGAEMRADRARIAKLEAALMEIRDFTADVSEDHPLSHVHGVAVNGLKP
ncbi:MAG: hypothetical protein KJZ80_19075 [Hyphomicrobiaceae bacterium]|nr:hypothetical protein [Hyphomicrobiaceae bacterium]